MSAYFSPNFQIFFQDYYQKQTIWIQIWNILSGLIWAKMSSLSAFAVGQIQFKGFILFINVSAYNIFCFNYSRFKNINILKILLLFI